MLSFALTSAANLFRKACAGTSLQREPPKTLIMETTKKISGIALALMCGLAATLKAQNLYIVNEDDGTIGEYGLDGQAVNASLITGLGYALNIAISGDDLFVANGGSVGEYTTSGTTIAAPLISTGLYGLVNIVISGSDIFVANDQFGTIGEYTTSGATVNASLISSFNPTGIAIGPAPEPSVGVLAGLVAAALWLWRRRRCSQENRWFVTTPIFGARKARSKSG
jgi:MYXO-CTERM domain-containing protein